MQPHGEGREWLALVEGPLPVTDASAWVVQPDCGAIVTFQGTARDHSEGRPSVDRLEYEAYDELVVPKLAEVVAELRARWPAVGRVAMLHRTGEVPVTEAAVVVAVASPHRDDAFAAAKFAIDTLKHTVPIWKRERWAGGESWGLEAQHVTEVPQS